MEEKLLKVKPAGGDWTKCGGRPLAAGQVGRRALSASWWGNKHTLCASPFQCALDSPRGPAVVNKVESTHALLWPARRRVRAAPCIHPAGTPRFAAPGPSGADHGGLADPGNPPFLSI